MVDFLVYSYPEYQDSGYIKRTFITHTVLTPNVQEFNSRSLFTAITNAAMNEKNAVGKNTAGTTESHFAGIYSDFFQKLIIAYNAITAARINPNQLIGFVHSTTIAPAAKVSSQVNKISLLDSFAVISFI